MDEMRGLIQLDLSHNLLREVNVLSSLPECEVAYWSHNQLENIPDNIDGMKSLVTLDVSHNQVKYNVTLCHCYRYRSSSNANVCQHFRIVICSLYKDLFLNISYFKRVAALDVFFNSHLVILTSDDTEFLDSFL